jgi:hypothetical protein
MPVVTVLGPDDCVHQPHVHLLVLRAHHHTTIGAITSMLCLLRQPRKQYTIIQLPFPPSEYTLCRVWPAHVAFERVVLVLHHEHGCVWKHTCVL